MPRSITGKQLIEILRKSSGKTFEKEEINFNPDIITSEEIEEDFETSNMALMSTMYYRMIERCNLAHHGIMGKPESSSMSDFFELIKNNVDIRSYYKQKYKL